MQKSHVCVCVCVYRHQCVPSYRNLHSDRTSVHKHLCICLLLAETVFLFGIGQTGNEIACSVIAGILHYFFLAAFMWMAIEGFMLYVMLVEVFETESRWKWYYLCGYGELVFIRKYVGQNPTEPENGVANKLRLFEPGCWCWR